MCVYVCRLCVFHAETRIKVSVEGAKQEKRATAEAALPQRAT